MPLSALLCVLLLSSGAVLAQPAVPIWPQPASGSYGATPVLLDGSFAIACAAASPACPDPLGAAITRYGALIFVGGPPSAAPAAALVLPGLQITVAADAPLALGVDESYSLTVPADGTSAVLAAGTQWGALRGLESFSQLVAWARGGGATNYTVAAPVALADAPRYPWRAALIDTSRHFLPVAAILDVLDALAWNKLNILHLHAVDDQSWPLFSATLPRLTEAAYDAAAVYSHADLAAIVRHGWERGVRVLLEIDMPAHATAFGGGYPELTLACPGGETLLNPVPNATAGGAGDVYAVVGALLAEFLPLLGAGGDFFHFGGDEVSSLACWAASPAVAAFMAAQNYTALAQVRNYFESRLQAAAAAAGATAVFWEEVFTGGFDLRNDTVIDIWLSWESALAAIDAGHRVVISYGLYLNQQSPPGGAVYAFQDTWRNFYESDLSVNQTLTPAQAARVLGESVSMWGIQTDEQNIHANMWPRAAAPAERMWSPRELRNTTLAAPRIEAWRCRMAQRGIPAGPTTSSWCPLPAYFAVGPLAAHHRHARAAATTGGA